MTLTFERALWRGLSGAALLAVLGCGLTVGSSSTSGPIISPSRLLFHLMIVTGVALIAVHGLFRIGRPDIPARATLRPILFPMAAMMCAAGLELATMPQQSVFPPLAEKSALLGLAVIPLLSLGPILCIFAVLRLGAPENPGAAGGLCGLAATAIATLAYAATCDDGGSRFFLSCCLLAMAFMTTIGWLVGLRVLRW
ncbi:DUF1109 domain-containing protein [Rhizobium sp. P38BS-XIX]|uniref:NrsF family protein n=1 Tax=Rhizobium sp. P38BS-XIX TaxID=2726740 RepID=UPI001456A654|nr:NrsF family protein [Rhizobium sp. P38BS-XIX]NLS00719.1 DUF1109 domain-containing protein [Rhizobium sp. P38BS-XIX]